MDHQSSQDDCQEGTMRKLVLSLLTVAALGAAPLGFAADSACKLTGAWIGYLGPSASWTAIADGIGESNGTIVITYPAMDATLFGTFQSAVRISSFQGTWARKGGGQFAYSTVAIAVDALGTTLWVGKLSGTETMQPGCGTELVTAKFAAYAPDANPFTGTPFFTMDLPDHYGIRMPTP
jgi:hypothetical protein